MSGRGRGRIPVGATMQGSLQSGLFLYVATRADGAVATFPFAWQATAWCNGWAPPAPVTIGAQPA